ncbi:hypothetical protein [Flavihumibacter profundi]|uniref:hypothetical protein n=1 Tax=Flavihumibacter profundi TaxID=2716883 RepID=UPI001CC7BBA8|nr:hypothetical protein [Flavihumibacter profundi]MBZ5855782.1 hypothetical protein [Flavihumibacter profundi]
MKLDNLITQYLYQKKRLSLPGIGTFTTDGPAVKFENKYDATISNDLIEFVKTHTGKMQSLALSDLESYIMLNRSFLNIGKALYIEGIGTLVKTKEGLFDFTPGEMVAERMEDLTAESRKPSAFIDETRYHPENNNRQKWVIALISSLTLIIIVWGGWRLFVNNSTSTNTEIKPSEAHADTLVILATDSMNAKPDTSVLNAVDTSLAHQAPAVIPVATAQNSQWRFIIEQTTNKNRAYKRYNQLKDLGSKIEISSPDSITYKLYFLLPAMAADTARIRDSLRRFYDSKKVSVEQ